MTIETLDGGRRINNILLSRQIHLTLMYYFSLFVHVFSRVGMLQCTHAKGNVTRKRTQTKKSREEQEANRAQERKGAPRPGGPRLPLSQPPGEVHFFARRY